MLKSVNAKAADVEDFILEVRRDVSSCSKDYF
jgi:hypothetical protein